MQERFLLTLVTIIFSVNTFATGLDSIGVENNKGKQVIIHKVEAKENYYSIARRYKVLPKEVMSFNDNKALQIGASIKIPTDRDFVSAGKASAGSSAKDKKNPTADSFISHKVGPKETLYSIAKRFNTTVQEIIELNKLKANTLSIGQVLKIKQSGASASASEPVEESAKQIPIPPAATSPVLTDSNSSADTNANLLQLPPNRYGLRQVSERGVAVWIADENLDGTRMLALHRTAPVGTIVKITNPMTDRSTFVKVVGKFTENETTKDVLIVLTKATAEVLGALDKRFQVNIAYGVPNE